jgi:hypothetical protein
MPRAEEEEEPLALRASAPLPRVPPRPQAPPPARRPSNMTSSFAQAGFPPRMKPTLPLFSAPQPKPQLTIGPFGDGLELAPASQMVPSSTVLQPLPGMTQVSSTYKRCEEGDERLLLAETRVLLHNARLIKFLDNATRPLTAFIILCCPGRR